MCADLRQVAGLMHYHKHYFHSSQKPIKIRQDALLVIPGTSEQLETVTKT